MMHRPFINAVVLAAVASLLLVLPAAAARSPFVGHWIAVDSHDGSDIRLTIAGGGVSPFHVVWTESYFSFCGGKAGIVTGTAWLNPSDPNVLEADLQIKCFTLDKSQDFHETWTYDASADAITDGTDTWHRPG